MRAGLLGLGPGGRRLCATLHPVKKCPHSQGMSKVFEVAVPVSATEALYSEPIFHIGKGHV